MAVRAGGSAGGQIRAGSTTYSPLVPSPTITGVSDLTIQHGQASVVITGDNFSASGNKVYLVRSGVSVEQTITSETTTDITITVSRGTLKYGSEVAIRVEDENGLLGPAFPITSLLPPDGWSYVDVVTPNPNPSLRLTAIPDATVGDQVSWETVGDIVTVYNDLSFMLLSPIADFDVELWTPVDGWGAVANQTISLPDTTAPSGYSISFVQDVVIPSNQSSISIQFADAEVGTTYNITVTSSAGGTPVNRTGTISSATQVVTGINVTNLPDGILTASATLRDSSDNTGLPSSDTIVKDTTAPTGQAVSFVQTVVNSSNASNIAFNYFNSEVGSTYEYTITSSGGGTPVSGSGEIATLNGTISGLNLSGLNDGTLTLSFVLEDEYGNVASPVTATINKDTVAPSSYTITILTSPINSGNRTNVSVRLNNAQVGASYSIEFTSSNGGTPVARTGTVNTATQNVTGINLTNLNDGQITATLILTDPAGNSGSPATDSVTKDTVAPTGYSVVWDQSSIDASNQSNAGFTIQNGEVNSVFNYTITSSNGGTVTGSGTVISSSQSVTGINLSSIADGLLTLSVTLTDVNGNVGLPSTSTISKQVPPVFTSLTVQAISYTTAAIRVVANETSVAKLVILPSPSSQPLDGQFNASTRTLNLLAGVGQNFNVTGLTPGTQYDFWVRLTDITNNTAYSSVSGTTTNDSIPVITLLGANPININKGDMFVDPGATANDAEDGDITGNIIVTGSVNTSVPGTYTLQYNVTDSAGQPAVTVTRVVNVLETATTGTRDRLVDKLGRPLANLTNLTVVIRADLDSTNVLYSSNTASTDSNGFLTILTGGIGAVGSFVYLTIGTSTRDKLGEYRVQVRNFGE